MLKEYLAELQKTPLLSREEETELWQRYAGGDQEAYNKLMTSYQPLVFKTAAGFRLPEQQTMELVQEGMLGLLEAAERYDYKRGIAFSVFAVHRIRGRMLDFLHVEDGAKSFSLDDTNAAGIAWADVLAASGRTPFEEAELNMACQGTAGADGHLSGRPQRCRYGRQHPCKPRAYLPFAEAGGKTHSRHAVAFYGRFKKKLIGENWYFCAFFRLLLILTAEYGKI